MSDFIVEVDREQKKMALQEAAKAALAIQKGACNGLAVGADLLDAYRAFFQFFSSTATANRAAPVKLILHQLCHLAGLRVDLDLPEYERLVKECKRLAECGMLTCQDCGEEPGHCFKCGLVLCTTCAAERDMRDV